MNNNSHRHLYTVAAFTLYSIAAAATAQPQEPVHLTVQPLLKGNAFNGLQVQLIFTACKVGDTAIKLPDEWGGEIELYKAVRDVRVAYPRGVRLSPTDKPDLLRLSASPGARVTLQYRIADDAASKSSSPKQDGNDYRPQIKPKYFHILGNALLVEPACTAGDAPARFTLKGMPKGQVFASDLEHQGKGRSLTMSDLKESVLVGGDFRVINAGSGVRMAIRGQWPQADAQWRDSFTRVAQAQRRYWGSGDEPFLVTVIPIPPVQPGSISVGGTGRTDAFALFATSNAPPATLITVMAHEMMHTWVPRRIGSLTFKDQQLQYWLSEGFTDWTSWRVMVRAGIWQPADFAREFNAKVKDYDQSQVKAAPNSVILQKFWTDGDVQNLPYRRGMVLAMYWDDAVRRATNGTRTFDDVLLEMQRLSVSNSKPEGGAPQVLKQAMQTVAGIDITQDLARYVDEGQPVVLAADTFAPCGDFKTLERPAFHRGFDVEATLASGNIISGVVPDGPAYKAGLRDGMKLIARRGGEIGNSSVEIAYEVLDNGSNKTLRWMPVGQGTERYRALQLGAFQDAASKQACVKRLGG
jgi:predicted metalloprotease with PDZ domain